MNSMRVNLIAAMSENRVIGRENQLPWHLPEDLKRFRRITSGHPVIMGRKTFESIGRLLPQRENIILSRQPGYQVEGALVLQSLEEALQTGREKVGEIFVIGGAEIYRQALPFADRIHLTVVHQDVEGDAFFPEWDEKRFKEVGRERVDGPLAFSFLTLDRLD